MQRRFISLISPRAREPLKQAQPPEASSQPEHSSETVGRLYTASLLFGRLGVLSSNSHKMEFLLGVARASDRIRAAARASPNTRALPQVYAGVAGISDMPGLGASWRTLGVSWYAKQ